MHINFIGIPFVKMDVTYYKTLFQYILYKIYYMNSYPFHLKDILIIYEMDLIIIIILNILDIYAIDDIFIS